MCRVYKSGMRTGLFTLLILTLFLGFSTDAYAHPHAWISDQIHCSSVLIVKGMQGLRIADMAISLFPGIMAQFISL